MYQIEVKTRLIERLFQPSERWQVTVDVDAMELGKGGQHPPEKRVVAARWKERLERLGVRLGAHPTFGRVDIAASHPAHGTVLVEVEGQSSRQREQAMYSALGQALLMMDRFHDKIRYAVAVPDEPRWEDQVRKIPHAVLDRLSLRAYLVSAAGVRELKARS